MTALKTLVFVFIFTILLRHLEVEVFENLRKSFAELGPHRVRPAGGARWEFSGAENEILGDDRFIWVEQLFQCGNKA